MIRIKSNKFLVLNILNAEAIMCGTEVEIETLKHFKQIKIDWKLRKTFSFMVRNDNSNTKQYI